MIQDVLVPTTCNLKWEEESQGNLYHINHEWFDTARTLLCFSCAAWPVHLFLHPNKVHVYFTYVPFQGILFSTPECLKSPQDLVKLYLHESNRVYRDKMVEEKDFSLFDKIQTEIVKKYCDVSDIGTFQMFPLRTEFLFS